MRIDSLMLRECSLLALVLAAVLGSAACNEDDGTEEWPGVYPPEAEIDRPKGGDAGARDAGSPSDAASDAEADEDAAALDAATDAGSSDAGRDAGRPRDGGAG